MRTAYIAIVGTREIRIDDKTLSDHLKADATLPRTIREFSRTVRDNYDTYRDRITAPILVPGLQRVLESMGKQGKIDEVLLFATDQPSATKHANDDTLYLAEILERRLPELLGRRITHVSRCPIPGNPADYDKMYHFFAEHLPSRINPSDFGMVWVAPAGGPSASNTGMLLNAVRLYQRSCQTIFVYENGTSQTLDVHGEILQNFGQQEAKGHLARRDFGALRETMQRAALGAPWLWHLCTYAERRLHFDFDGAHDALDKALNVAPGGDARTKLTRCRHSLTLLRKNVTDPDSTSSLAQWNDWFEVQAANISELYFNLDHKVQREEWVDFLGRLFRLHEAALRLMFERQTKHSAEMTKKYRDFYKAVDADSSLAPEFAPKAGVTYRPSVDTAILRRWLKCETVRPDPANPSILAPSAATFKVQYDRSEPIEKLKIIRNKSIMAHGYKGINRAELENNLTPQSIEGFVAGPMRDYLADATIGAHVDPTDNPFSPIVTWLEKVLDT